MTLFNDRHMASGVWASATSRASCAVPVASRSRSSVWCSIPSHLAPDAEPAGV